MNTTDEVKAQPIETPFGNLYPNISNDRLEDGREITSGSMFMQIHAGVATVTHKKKKVEINIGSGLNGSTVLLVPGGRYFVLDLQKFIQHAIDNGFLDDSLKFAPASS